MLKHRNDPPRYTTSGAEAAAGAGASPPVESLPAPDQMSLSKRASRIMWCGFLRSAELELQAAIDDAVKEERRLRIIADERLIDSIPKTDVAKILRVFMQLEHQAAGAYIDGDRNKSAAIHRIIGKLLYEITGKTTAVDLCEDGAEPELEQERRTR